MQRIIVGMAIAISMAFSGVRIVQGSRLARQTTASLARKPVIDWSNEVRRAIVPAGKNGVFGAENYGDKFPGEAAIYMGIVHAAMYDVAVAIDGGYRPYAAAVTAPPDTSPEAAIATVAHHVLDGLLSVLDGSPTQREKLTTNYEAYLSALNDTPAAKENGIALGDQVAKAWLALRDKDGRENTPTVSDLDPPKPGPGVWEEGPTAAVGLRVPGIRPLALKRASQFRPDEPNPMDSAEYARDYQEVLELGRATGSKRSDAQTTQALFWTDHDLRQWNDGMLALADKRDLDLMQTARMLAMAHVAGADAMIGCFDAKYKYWFWRPFQAIPRGDEDPNPATVGEQGWVPLGTTPSFPEYPSAHACHTTAIAEALQAFFGTDKIRFTLDSRITGTTRTYERFHEAYKDVDWARVLVGFHFRGSDQVGSNLGRKVARYVVAHRFLPLD